MQKKEKRRKRVPPDKLRAAAMGTWYDMGKTVTFICTGCGEERNSIGQKDGLCLRCRWEKKGPVVEPGRKTGN